MTIKTDLQKYYNAATGNPFADKTSLTSIAGKAALLGYGLGCVVKWIRPLAPLTPLGCAAAIPFVLPVAVGCTIAVQFISHRYFKDQLPAIFGITAFIAGATVCSLAAIPFSANPVIPPIILGVTIIVAACADKYFETKSA